jgi:hypothetical protein
LDKISSIVPGRPLAGREEAIAKLDPQKIYLENVRSALGVSHFTARQIADAAVRQGVFEKRVEVVCPDGVAAANAKTEAELPVIVHCWTEQNGNVVEQDLPTSTLRKVVFYRLR